MMPAILGPANARRVAAASLLAVLSVLAHNAGVDRGFQPISVTLVDGERRPDGRLLRVPLPTLTMLRDSVLILSGELTNGAPRQQVRVTLGGASRAELPLAPAASARFSIALSEGAARALTAGAGHELAIVGEHADWRLTRLDAANTYADVGAVASIVPRQVHPAEKMAWSSKTIVAMFALCTAIWGLAFARRWLRRMHQPLAAAALLLLTSLWLMPLVAPVRLLVTPFVYWPAVGVVFGPGLARAIRWAAASIVALSRMAARLWGAHPVTFERGAILLGLVAMAILQPLFEVLGTSPEFFVARNTTAAVAIGVVVAIAFGFPLLLLAIERVVRKLSVPVATLLFQAFVAVLVTVLVHPWMRRRELADPWVMAALAIGAGVAATLVAWRSRVARQFLAALSPAAVIVPVLFFLSADVRGALVPVTSTIAAPNMASTPPIVMVVFDEFPLHSLLDDGGSIDAVRFPHFAALAREADWFREVTSVSSQTVWAVPALASGRYPIAPGAVPTLRYYPANLFTLLAGRYQMHVFGRFLQLCPEDTCQRDLQGPGDGPVSLAADLGVVWLHIVLPKPLTDDLPPVVGDWMGFARAGKWRSSGGHRIRNDRRGEFDRFLATIDDHDARLYFLHSLLPHMPFEYVPSERRYEAPDYQNREENGAGLFHRASAEYADALHQRHLLQVGFVDALVGRLVARLRQLGIYDRTLLIVTADHGASYREGVSRRGARAQNLADIVRVPLFIKRPGQRAGAVIDGLAESVDVLPSVASVLGMHLPFEVDGQSLFEAGRMSRKTRTFIERSFSRVYRRDATNWQSSSQVSLARRLARFGVGPLESIYAVGDTRAMLARRASDFQQRSGPLRVQLITPADFVLDPASDTWPLYVRGRVYGRPEAPLAILVNGRVAATTKVYTERGATFFSTLIPESAVSAGRNDISVALVEHVGGSVALVSTRP